MSPLSLRQFSALARSSSSRMPSLFSAGLRVLSEPDVHKKAALTLALADDWRQGRLSLELDDGDDPSAVPLRPARPSDVATVQAGKTKGSNTIKSTIHSLVHAESYAIDLSADIMVRFGWDPRSWGVPATVGEKMEPAGRGEATLPQDFFDDWVTVAEEEALHFNRWLDRLRALGGDYGQFPVHDSLWQSAEETAYSLGARLAVVHCVHEARGLDTYPSFLARLEGAGDTVSAATLQLNVGQEVHHVRRGRKWLQWIADREGRSAEAPLIYQTLARRHFKGLLRPPFNETDRNVAGLTREWWEPLTRAASPPPQAASDAETTVASASTGDDAEDTG